MAEPSTEIPRPAALDTWYYLTDVAVEDGRIIYYGDPLIPEKRLYRELQPAFQELGYELKLTDREASEGTALVAIPLSEASGHDGIPWTNLILFIATVFSTLLVGATVWYFIPLREVLSNPFVIFRAWPFSAAVLGVLLVHELGHYAAGRYYGVNVSLPYLLPVPIIFGTMGAVIRMRGRIPNRKVLFDIGVAGPIAGLVATVVVTAIGLSLGPIEIPPEVVEQADSNQQLVFNNPPLLDLIAWLIGAQATYSDPALNPHPVVIGGWVGMFFTFLNLLPVGQLDGGHMVRAMIGRRQETIAAMVPGVLFAIAGYLYFLRGLSLNDSVMLWAIWGLFMLLIAYNGPAEPLDETAIGRRRLLVGILTFAVGLLCFMLVPIQVQG